MEKNRDKKFKRKIKIRLLDANNPDSYICEIFDSSIESDDINEQDTHGSFERSSRTNNENFKSYFEILMSKNLGGKNNKYDSSKENQEIVKNSIKMQSGTSGKSSRVKPVKGKTNEKEPVRVLEEKQIKMPEYDSSDDESLFQIRQKSKTPINVEAINSRESSNDAENESIEIVYESAFQPGKNSFLSLFGKPQTVGSKEMKKIEKVRGNQSKCNHSIKSCKKKSNVAVNAMGGALQTCSQKEESKVEHYVNKKNIKLAPLFLIKERKAIDLEAQKARYNFLHKETKLLKTLDNNNKNVDVSVEFQPTCHIQQRDDSHLWAVRKIGNFKPELPPLEDYKFLKTFRINISRNNLTNYHSNFDNEKNINTPVEVDNKLLRELKAKYSTLQFDPVIDGLKVKRDKYKKLKNAFASTRATAKTSVDDKSTFEYLNSLWTERYKPSSYEIIGNDKIVNKLRNWLKDWKTFDEELKNLAVTSRKSKKEGHENDSDDDDDEDDYFINSDDENFGLKAPVNVCVLSGPNGCGKSTLVSSLAEELDFNVLEVNASSKRTGKKVLTDFQEATQSHKVQHLSVPQMNTFFKPMKKKKEKKLKVKCVKDDRKERKISLLLIEDADIVFEEHDEGFYSAVASLVQTSKRPFVFVTNNVNCEQLENFKTDECLLLEMKNPPFNQCCALLNLVALFEGAPINEEIAEFLIIQNRFDLRKSLLDLQFWNDSIREVLGRRDMFDLGRFWWGLSRFLYPEKRNSLFDTVKFKRKRKDLENVASEDEDKMTAKRVKICPDDGQHLNLPAPDSVSGKTAQSFELFCTMMDVASTLDLIGFSENEEPIPGIEYQPKSSLSLEENMEDVRWGENRLREDICSGLVDWSEQLFAERRGSESINHSKISFSIPSWDDIRWRNSLEEAQNELCRLVPSLNGRDTKCVHLDYLPIIRNICKGEKTRSATNNKRKNRFSHYFDNSEVQLSDKTLNTSCHIFNR